MVGTDADANDGGEYAPNCTHIDKAILPKARSNHDKLKPNEIGICARCCKAQETAAEAGDKSSKTSVNNFDTVGCTQDLWLCLHCGQANCGRYIAFGQSHAAKHAENNDEHKLVIHAFTGRVWCYKCDNFVAPDASPKLAEQIKKMTQPIEQVRARYSQREQKKDPFSDYKPTFPLKNGELKQTTPPAAVVQKSTDKMITRNQQQLAPIATQDELIHGLQNLGNTCFFNSIMQNIAHSHVLLAMVVRLHEHRAAVVRLAPTGSSGFAPIDVLLDADNGAMTQELIDFLREYHSDKSTVMKPGKLHPRFRGYAQQDSHELLRCMLDSVRTEENRRVVAAICKQFSLDSNLPIEKQPKGVQPKILAYAFSNDITFVDRIFGGQLLQTIKCAECGQISTRLESFLDLSLPIADQQKVKAAADRVPNTGNDTPDSETDDREYSSSNGASSRAQRAAYRLAKKKTPVELKHSPGSDFDRSVEDMQINDADDSATTATSSTNSIDDIDYQSKLRLLLQPLRVDDSTPYTASCNLGTCLRFFTSVDWLTGKNQFGCTNCYRREEKASNTKAHTSKTSEKTKTEKEKKFKFVNAEKRYMIFRAPPVLTIHLKRFQRNGYSYSKDNTNVQFPITFDLAPYMCKYADIGSNSSSVMYSLTGTVCHSGGMSGGHYVAYVRVRSTQQVRDAAATLLRFADMKTAGTQNRAEVDRDMLAQILQQQQQKVMGEPAPGPSPPTGRWHYASDSHTSLASERDVLGCMPYLLFYERVM